MPPAPEFDNIYLPPVQSLRPYIAGDVVSRPRLYKLLEQGASLALVVAPAGYGKTTLIANWLEMCREPATWVTFGAEVNSLHHFLTYFLTAVAASLPQVTNDALQELLGRARCHPLAPSWKELAAEVCNKFLEIV